jgi:nicotinate-nucleotide adenylyltransferase
MKKFKIDKLIWVITKKNPLKNRPYLNINTRIKLSKKITKDKKKISVRSFDNKVKSVNTFDSLKYIKNKYKKNEIFFLMGADNLEKFHKWKNWDKITKLAKIIIFPRLNYSMKSLKSIVSKKLNEKDLIYIKSKKINISSSLIRKFW